MEQNEVLSRERVAERIKKDLVRTEGDFELSAGGESSFYVDMKAVTAYPELHRSLNTHAAEKLEDEGLEFEAVGSEGMGGTQTAGPLAYHIQKPVTMLRGEKKDYGTEKSWEGIDPEGKSFLVVDDVITTGGSAIEMIERLEDLGANVKAFFVFVDREEGGLQNVEDETGVETYCLYDKHDVMG